MTLQRREKILACAAGGLLIAAAVWFLLMGGDARSTTQLRIERDKMAADVQTKQGLVDAAARDAKRLAEWQRRALPSNRAIARSLYQNWLRGLANRFHFRQLNVESKEVESRRNMFTRMSFAVRGQVELADLTQFLYEFYATGHLHQIRLLDIKPQPDSPVLDVNLTVEALSLPEADRKDQLSKEPGRVLRLAKLDDYRDPIVKRNLFAAYSPPPSSRSRRDGPGLADATKQETPFDSAKYVFVTGFTEIDGARQVWIQDRTAGKMWRLGEGEKFQIGTLHGAVRTIAPTGEVVLDFDGRSRRLRNGENLRGGVEIDAAGKN